MLTPSEAALLIDYINGVRSRLDSLQALVQELVEAGCPGGETEDFTREVCDVDARMEGDVSVRNLPQD